MFKPYSMGVSLIYTPTKTGDDRMKVQELFQHVIDNGGITVSVHLDKVDFDRGYQASVKGYNVAVSVNVLGLGLFKSVLDAYTLNAGILQSAAKEFNATPYIGIWYSSDTLHFDVSLHFDNLYDALVLAKDQRQLAVYNWETGKDIRYVVAEDCWLDLKDNTWYWLDFERKSVYFVDNKDNHGFKRE